MSITINGHQLRQALEVADEDDTELEFEHLDAHKDAESGEMMPAGLYCWLGEYPEEGVMYLQKVPDRDGEKHARD